MFFVDISVVIDSWTGLLLRSSGGQRWRVDPPLVRAALVQPPPPNRAPATSLPPRTVPSSIVFCRTSDPFFLSILCFAVDTRKRLLLRIHYLLCPPLSR